ncbi:MAG: hypothetical protein ACREOP_02190 [Thermodesulfobacteriota bacterium]
MDKQVSRARGPLIFIPKIPKDCIIFKPIWTIWRHKNEDDFGYARERRDLDILCFDKSEIPGNLLLNEGAEVIWTALFAGGITLFNNTNARIGVGDSSTAEADTQTALQGSTSFKAMDTSFPALSGTGNDTIEFQSVFGSAEGNQAWNEFTVDNGNSANKNLNRKVSAQGTKSSGQTWTIKISIQAT